jgi:hypothetical protein
VLGARPAGPEHPLAQSPASAVEAHHRVVGGDPGLGGEVDGPDAVEVHPAQRLLVRGRQGRQQRLEAPAQLGLHVGCGHGRARPLASESFPAPLRRGAPSPVVGQGAAQQTIEPRHDALPIADLAGALDRLDERRLQDVLGFLAAAETPLEEGQEPTPAPQQLSDLLTLSLAR